MPNPTPELLETMFTGDFDDRRYPYRPITDRPIITSGLGVNLDELPPDFVFPPGDAMFDGSLIYSLTPNRNLPGIDKHGLQIMRNKTGNRSAIYHEGVFFSERPEHLTAFDRTRCLYASPVEPEWVLYIDENDTLLEMVINSDDAIVADQGVWDDAVKLTQNRSDQIEKYVHVDDRRAAFEELVRPFARRYWADAMPLVDYVDNPREARAFKIPEVLIQCDVPRSQIRTHRSTVEEELFTEIR